MYVVCCETTTQIAILYNLNKILINCYMLKVFMSRKEMKAQL